MLLGKHSSVYIYVYIYIHTYQICGHCFFLLYIQMTGKSAADISHLSAWAQLGSGYAVLLNFSQDKCIADAIFFGCQWGHLRGCVSFFFHRERHFHPRAVVALFAICEVFSRNLCFSVVFGRCPPWIWDMVVGTDHLQQGLFSDSWR